MCSSSLVTFNSHPIRLLTLHGGTEIHFKRCDSHLVRGLRSLLALGSTFNAMVGLSSGRRQYINNCQIHETFIESPLLPAGLGHMQTDSSSRSSGLLEEDRQLQSSHQLNVVRETKSVTMSYLGGPLVSQFGQTRFLSEVTGQQYHGTAV